MSNARWCWDLNGRSWGAWVAQVVKRLTWAQVMISWFTGSSPASGSALTVWSLPGILSLPLSLPLPHFLVCVCVCVCVCACSSCPSNPSILCSVTFWLEDHPFGHVTALSTCSLVQHLLHLIKKINQLILGFISYLSVFSGRPEAAGNQEASFYIPRP